MARNNYDALGRHRLTGRKRPISHQQEQAERSTAAFHQKRAAEDLRAVRRFLRGMRDDLSKGRCEAALTSFKLAAQYSGSYATHRMHARQRRTHRTRHEAGAALIRAQNDLLHSKCYRR